MDELPRSADGWAFFFDLDGTLIDIAPTPETIVVPRELPVLLTELAAKAGGALAVVSGRTIATIDRLLEPAQLPAAGLHGAELRFADGARTVAAAPAALLSVRAMLAEFARAHPPAFMEDKGAAASIHYRAAPELEPAVVAFVEAAVAGATGLVVQRGKMVVEVRPAGTDKGTAVQAFMARAPFRGRRPIAVGDDLTDEHMFVVAQRMGGLAVRVGNGGDTAATVVLPAPEAVRAWLATLS